MALVSLIWAQSRNKVIGTEGRIPWRLLEDMQHFTRCTDNGVVIMGRKTWESLAPIYRPLPRRRNIVITRQPGYDAVGGEVVNSLEDAFIRCTEPMRAVWVIGGSEIYHEAMPFASTLIVTELHDPYHGDTFAPDIDPTLWFEVNRSNHRAANGIAFDKVCYLRRSPAQPIAPKEEPLFPRPN